uniref:ATP synthase subunit a n=1 Tax=Micrura ignea TaxID=328822 RepID=A0A0D5NTT0_9BILA|nr:ATP synthase F0 subunit 6 [Micrura ignea]AJY78578.1 ATP synthase F0 subunit 6 [Micrura ignea]
MLMDIFSSFDEQNGNFFSLGFPMWVVGSGLVSLLVVGYWWQPSRWEAVVMSIKSFMWEQVSRYRGGALRGFSLVVMALMVLLLVLNLGGLIPYVFSTTSHLALTFGLALPLWFSLILSGAFFKPDVFCASLLPAGAPSGLNPFLVLVETVSIAVRPITLSVRLAANMGAGHIVLSLLGGYMSSGFFVYSVSTLAFMVGLEVFYFMFEVGICLIQGYIFFLLLNLYADEHS